MISDSNHKIAGLPAVKIVKVLPEISERQLFAHRQCYLGISLENPAFEGESLFALMQWATERFDRCLVIVGDYLCRYNQLIFSKCSQEEAAEAANKLGDLFLQKNAELFRRFPADKVRLTRWEQHLQTPQFASSLAVLNKLFASNPEFRGAIETDALGFIKRQKKHNRTFSSDTAYALKLSCQYLLEEIAVFSALSEQGWEVEVYPGPELEVLAQIENGIYMDIPDGLKKRINVELKISGSIHK